jgi:hypothetical protein
VPNISHFADCMLAYSESLVALFSDLIKFETALSLLADPRFSTRFEMQATESMELTILLMHKLSGMV